MADNLDVDPGTSILKQPVATDDISGVQYQRIKLIHGDDGVNDGDVSKLNPLPICPGNGASDAFGRLRTSSPETLIEEKNVSVSPNIGNKVENGGTVVRQAARASFLLGTNGATSTARRQSRQRAPYQPGKSQQIQVTFVGSTPTADIVQRVGAFDDNNGLFFEVDGEDLCFVIRSNTSGSTVDTQIPRAQWIDKLDGTGQSGLTIDVTKAQILQIDFQWLGVGTVRFGFVINGKWVICYQNHWANIGDVVYMANPNLPIAWHILSTGSTEVRTLECICGKIASEGGFDRRGLSLAFDVEGATVTDALTEVLAIRLDTTGVEFGIAFAEAVRILCTTNSNYIYKIFLNPTGMSGGTWNPPTGSFMEYSTDRTGTPGGPGSVLIDQGYGTTSQDSSLGDIFNLTGLGYDINAGASDILSLCLQKIGVGSDTYYASIIMRQEA